MDSSPKWIRCAVTEARRLFWLSRAPLGIPPTAAVGMMMAPSLAEGLVISGSLELASNHLDSEGVSWLVGLIQMVPLENDALSCSASSWYFSFRIYPLNLLCSHVKCWSSCWLHKKSINTFNGKNPSITSFGSNLFGIISVTDNVSAILLFS